MQKNGENGGSKELRVRMPEDSHDKVRKIMYLSRTTKPEAVILALDIASETLEKKYNGTRPGIVNGKR